MRNRFCFDATIAGRVPAAWDSDADALGVGGVTRIAGHRCYAPAVPAHRQRSGVQEARIAGLAILLSVAVLILVVVYLVGGYAHHVVIEIVPVVPAAPAVSSG
jgi:hypothetical protein